MISLILRILLYPSPRIVIDKDQEEQFEKLFQDLKRLDGHAIEYDISYPKYQFLYYLSQKTDFVFHGSNNQEIETLEPRNQTLYNGVLTNAVFATTDPIWPMFYAVFKRSSLIGNIRNGCLVNLKKRYHFYSLSCSTMENNPWTNGTIYILPKVSFSRSGNGKVHFDEWISHEPIKPLGRLAVTVDDFYFKDKVSTHKDNEPLMKTWLLYKLRTLWAVSKKASNRR